MQETLIECLPGGRINNYHQIQKMSMNSEEAFERRVLNCMGLFQLAPSVETARQSLLRHWGPPAEDVDQAIDEACRRLEYDPDDERGWKDSIDELTEADLLKLVKIKG